MQPFADCKIEVIYGGFYLNNNTKIKYIKVLDKLYQITRISFFYMEIEATETNLTSADVPSDEVWDIDFFQNFHIKLINNSGKAEIIDFAEWNIRKK